MSKLHDEITDALNAHGVDNALTPDEYDTLVDELAGLPSVGEPIAGLREDKPAGIAGSGGICAWQGTTVAERAAMAGVPWRQGNRLDPAPLEDDGPTEPLERDDLIEAIITAFTGEHVVDADALWQYRVARDLADALLDEYEISRPVTPTAPLRDSLPSFSGERAPIVYARPEENEDDNAGE